MIANATAIPQHKLDIAFLCGPLTLLSFCRHMKNRPQRATAYRCGVDVVGAVGASVVQVLFTLRRSPSSDWACFFTIVDGEIENYGYGIEGEKE
jgi:hypothetical protein